MDVLLSLCRALSDTSFLRETPRSQKCDMTAASPRFDRVVWLIYRHLSHAMSTDRVGGNSAARASPACRADNGHGNIGRCGCVEDFFVLNVEHFVARYYRLLAQLSFADRRLVLGVKYKLAFTLEHVCPPNAALLSLWQCNNAGRTDPNLSSAIAPRALLATSTATTSAADIVADSTAHQFFDGAGGCDGGIGGVGGVASAASAASASMASFDCRFARCYFMVTSMVSYTDHDYRKILQQQTIGRKCTCDGYGSCRFCQALVSLARRNAAAKDPYRPPNPHDWIKSRALLLGENNNAPVGPFGNVDGTHGRLDAANRFPADTVNEDRSTDYQVVLSRFRRQTLRTDVYAAIKRARAELGNGNVPVKKFRTESLPPVLLYATKHSVLSDEVAQKDLSGVFNRDLSSLLSHFSINWCKLHYLEPAIFPAHGDC